MESKVLRVAQIGYGMFGSDIVAGTLWDLQRNGIAPYLDRLGLDDWAKEYVGVKVELVAIGERSEQAVQRALQENEERIGVRPRAYLGDTSWEDIMDDHPDLDMWLIATPDHLHAAPILSAL